MLKSFFSFCFFLIVSGSAYSTDNSVVQSSIQEEQNLYKQIADVSIKSNVINGKLSLLYGRNPLVVALIFSRCSGICSPFLQNLKEQVSLIDTTIPFKVLVLSFDPRDEVEDMNEIASHYELENNPRWIFAATPEIDKFNQSVGFKAVWDEKRQQYDHEALLTGVNKDGFIIRKLLGVRELPALKSLVADINGEFVLSYPLPGRESMFNCFTYDPATGEKKPSWGLLLLGSPVLITLFIILFISLNRKRIKTPH